MDRDERIDSRLVAFRRAFAGFQAGLWTALPARVESFDAAKRTVSLQPTIQAQIQDKEGAWSNVNLPVLPDVPVLFPGAGNYVLTFPVAVGDEGIVIFASRCIDAFWQQGGVQPQAELRMHDLSDGMFLPGSLSQAQSIPNLSTTAVQLRTKDGVRHIESTATGFKVLGTLEVVGNVTVTGDVAIVGNEDVTGGIDVHGVVTGHAVGGLVLNSNVTINGATAISGAVTGSNFTAGAGPNIVSMLAHIHAANNTPPTPGH